MGKKGQSLSINTVIVAILALIVLVILILLVSGQIRKSASSYTKIGEEAEKEFKDESCTGGLLTVRKCATSQSELPSDYYWSDLGTAGCNQGQRCFERGEGKQG